MYEKPLLVLYRSAETYKLPPIWTDWAEPPKKQNVSIS
jgi:hypothetical protein